MALPASAVFEATLEDVSNVVFILLALIGITIQGC